MPTITKAGWTAYSGGVRTAAQAAADDMAKSLAAWMGQNPGASIADVREEAARLYRDIVARYGQAASSWAAWFYDEVVQACGLDLDAAELFVDDVSAEADKIARYQATKLQKGKIDEFIVQMSKAARDATSRAASRTVIHNQGRFKDRKARVRYARVLSGMENCTFCVMLASRGFTYWSEDAAGKFDKWHRGCDCLIVPGVADTEIEGYNMGALYGLWGEMRKVDAQKDMTWAEKKAKRQELLDATEIWT